MAINNNKLDNFLNNFSDDFYYSLDPIFENNIKKLIDKKKVFNFHDKIQKIVKFISLFCYAAVAFVLSIDTFLNKLLYVETSILFLTIATLIILGFTSHYFASIAKKKKADFDKIRLFVIEESHYIIKQQDDRNYLAQRLQEECDINIYHP
ncbi:hypothetical protein CIB95_07190 [Lottiidibacillus patelloidae]|uniref:Uncharacterized protein n=1 Tax=Lottiidibacillus patelloidae TaxID=2670334 RepID=A0A263BU17_9BACI|nr:DUF2663 family protein [Lottiidibacillus patelloidae]OZM57241.1 hypothetical protein CIB95_07190 [Lottiidibacillus patelloidae]